VGQHTTASCNERVIEKRIITGFDTDARGVLLSFANNYNHLFLAPPCGALRQWRGRSLSNRAVVSSSTIKLDERIIMIISHLSSDAIQYINPHHGIVSNTDPTIASLAIFGRTCFF
jgi:hypothetical protein